MQELSLNILDIAQNSVAAGASLVEIGLVYRLEEGEPPMLTITVADNGRGMSEETARQVADPFYTTRTTRKVGLGTSLFKLAAELTGGSFGVKSRPGEGTVVTAVLYPDHLDGAPHRGWPRGVQRRHPPVSGDPAGGPAGRPGGARVPHRLCPGEHGRTIGGYPVYVRQKWPPPAGGNRRGGPNRPAVFLKVNRKFT